MNKFLQLQLDRASFVSLLEENKPDEAIEAIMKHLKKLSTTAFFNPFLIGKCCCEKKKSKEIFIEKIAPIAKKLMDEGKYSQALKCFRSVYDIENKNSLNLESLILCLEKLKQFDIGLKLARQYVKNNKKNPDAYKFLCDMHKENNDFQSAINNYLKYIKLAQKTPDVQDNSKLGFLYFNYYTNFTHNPKDIQSANEYFKNALELTPYNRGCIKNYIFGLRQAKDYKTEQKYWKIYFENDFADKEDEFVYSSSCLLRGDIAGWERYYESRYEKPSSFSKYPKTSKPRWDGTADLTDKTLLVIFEQGFGDTILIAGYMQRLKKIAKHVIFYVQDALYDLLTISRLGVEIQCAKTANLQKIDHDCFILAMSIPKALRLDKSNISVGESYLKADECLVDKFVKQTDTKKFKIGIAFKGNKNGQQKRDIPLDKLLELDKLRNVKFFCLTKDIDDEELKRFKRNKVVNIAREFTNFSDTAAVMEQMDLIVTSDNCILNLAGALGKETIALFNYHYEFRWYDLTGEDCGWYTSVMPIVNDEYNNWDVSIKKAMFEIKKIQERRK